jgi:hypothetical protein
MKWIPVTKIVTAATMNIPARESSKEKRGREVHSLMERSMLAELIERLRTQWTLLDGNTTLSRIKEPMCILFYMETMCI